MALWSRGASPPARLEEEEDLWVVKCDDDDRCGSEHARHILAVFRVGARVVIDYNMMGTLYAAVISKWDGGNKYAVTFEVDGSVCKLGLADMEIASTDGLYTTQSFLQGRYYRKKLGQIGRAHV